MIKTIILVALIMTSTIAINVNVAFASMGETRDRARPSVLYGKTSGGDLVAILTSEDGKLQLTS